MSRRKPPSDRTLIGPKKKIAFVCSGGAAKAGAFHLGVALALQEQGFRFYGGLKPTEGVSRLPGKMDISTYIGSSAGSMIATYLAAGYSLENIFNSFLGRKPSDPTDPVDTTPKILPKFTYQKMFKIRPGLAREQISQLALVHRVFLDLFSGNWEALMQFKWLKTTGIFSTAGIEQYLREEVLPSNRFQDYISDLFIVATQLNHSRKVVFGKYSYQPPPHDLTCQYDNDVPISNACAASTALPVIFAPYEITHSSGQTLSYIDGEIRDTLSTHVAIDSGADLVISSYTHQPYHFMKEIGSLTEHGLPSIIVQSIYLLVEQKINNHIHNKQVQRDAINAVAKYCNENGVSEAHSTAILGILQREMSHRTDVDTIYIHPSPTDAQMFFGDHFSLSANRMAEIVKSGFRAAIETLRRYEFADKAEAAGHARHQASR
ncbi:MAG TPA: patatin-like phospholipase family protein [Bdellovibrionota bacterium]|nr:patatin-like phospholipase family protein [Bdellovibrionota bacterium]